MYLGLSFCLNLLCRSLSAHTDIQTRTYHQHRHRHTLRGYIHTREPDGWMDIGVYGNSTSLGSCICLFVSYPI
ncbi:hypothetical protein F4811DRAFT_513587 [Daldinia bambusicola]|nr:hypothetical protein F4811DRAFT_513587 [Daldinia bambusicola]